MFFHSTCSQSRSPRNFAWKTKQIVLGLLSDSAKKARRNNFLQKIIGFCHCKKFWRLLFWFWGVQSQWKELQRSKRRSTLSQQIYANYVLYPTWKVKQIRYFTNVDAILMKEQLECALQIVCFHSHFLSVKWLNGSPSENFLNSLIILFPTKESILMYLIHSQKRNRSLSASAFSRQEKVAFSKVCLIFSIRQYMQG